MLVFDSLDGAAAAAPGTAPGSQLTPRPAALVLRTSASTPPRSRVSSRAACRACLDWSERRHHLAGALGAALLDRIFALRWASRRAGSRIVTFTPPGERAFHALLAPSPADAEPAGCDNSLRGRVPSEARHGR